MAKKTTELDVLVLGTHPSAYLAAALLKSSGKLNVAHVSWPSDPVEDRLALINPELFSLHKLLGPLRKKLALGEVYGAQFLSDDPEQRSEHRDASVMAYVASVAHLREAFCELAERQGVVLHHARTVWIEQPDEQGVGVTVSRTKLHPSALMVADRPAPEVGRTLGIPEQWPANVLHRYSFVLLERPDWLKAPAHPVVPMSLNLGAQLHWSWMLTDDRRVQLAVIQPPEKLDAAQPAALLRHWSGVLVSHGVLERELEFTDRQVRSVEVPLAGALEQEAVVDRTLLIGPAGGFCSASGEDIYPACWSAVFAAEVMKKALREEHLQDALQGFRHKWRTTLGDYLRGPQQNLRFLLPLVYRNQVMTTRLAESILLGKSVVR